MGYNVATLNNYTNENAEQLTMRSMTGARTIGLVFSEGNVKTGVKSSDSINIQSTDAIFQNGGSCGFTSSGNTSISQRMVTVGKIKINESLCPKTLETKYTQKALQKGSRYDKIPFEEEYANGKAGATAEQLEKAAWQGDTAHGDVNLNKFDGYIKLIDAAGTAVNGNPTNISVATGITASNVRSVVDGVVAALPSGVRDKTDVRIFIGMDKFILYIQSFTNANLFGFKPEGGEIVAGEVIIPGTTYRLTGVPGLDGTNRIFGIRMSNMWVGTDLENEEEKFEIFFAKEADEVRYVNEFKYGVQIAFPNEVVSFKLA